MIWFPITNLLLFLDDGRKLCIRDSRIQLTLKGKYMHSVYYSQLHVSLLADRNTNDIDTYMYLHKGSSFILFNIS